MTDNKIYTLVYIVSPYKTVCTHVFLSLEDLFDYKNFVLTELKNSVSQQVDKDGYVWFCEKLDD